MKRYARVEFVNAEQWINCEEPLDDIEEFADEVIETALVDVTRKVYVVRVGANGEPHQIRCTDWVLHLNDGTLEVLSDTMFRSMFIDADKANALLEGR